MYFKTVSAIFGLSLILVGCTLPPLIRMNANPRLISNESGIQTIAVIPPRIHVHYSSMQGPQAPYEIESGYAILITQALKELLPRFGFKMIEPDLINYKLKQDPQTKYELADLFQKFGRLGIKIDSSESTFVEISDQRITQGQLTLGPEVAPLAQQLGADALILAEGNAIAYSGGKKASGMAVAMVVGVGPAYYDQCGFIMTLVDGKTGTVMMAILVQLNFGMEGPNLGPLQEKIQSRMTYALDREPQPLPKNPKKP